MSSSGGGKKGGAGGGGGGSWDARGLQSVNKILQEMKKEPRCSIFLRPVIEEYPDLKDDYVMLIAKPMDFSTVEKNYKARLCV